MAPSSAYSFSGKSQGHTHWDDPFVHVDHRWPYLIERRIGYRQDSDIVVRVPNVRQSWCAKGYWCEGVKIRGGSQEQKAKRFASRSSYMYLEERVPDLA